MINTNVKGQKKKTYIIAISLMPFLVLPLLLVSFVNTVTEEEIKHQKHEELNRKIRFFFPDQSNQHIQKIESEALQVLATGIIDPTAWLVCDGDLGVGLVSQITTTEGYAGSIDLLMAINRAGKIVGVDTVRHEETPSLGDKIERSKSDWIDQFTDKDKFSSWKIKRFGDDGSGFDAITAATITSKAVVEILRQALQKTDRFQALFNLCKP